MSMQLLVGLGNPEPRYDLTRHNAGFMVIDKLATTCGASLSLQKHLHAEICRGRFAGKEVMLAKPMTYMNLSGRAVSAIMSYYKIDKSDLLVIHDEVALPLGAIRIARAGGSAGNHGIESIMESLGHKEFQRLRVGVGPDPGGELRAHFVLSKMEGNDLQCIKKVVDGCEEALGLWLREGVQKAMNQYNGHNFCPETPV